MAHAAPKHDPAAVKAASDDAHTIQTGEWQLGLFSCFEHIVPNCCMVYWLPCVSLAQISARLGVASYMLVLLSTLALFFVFGVLNCLYTLAVLDTIDENGYVREDTKTPTIAIPAEIAAIAYSAALVGLTAFLRGVTRARFSIPGNVCVDVLASLCCNCCAIAQLASHVKSYKKGSCDFAPRDTLPAYPQSSSQV